MASFLIAGNRSQGDAVFGEFKNTQCTSNSFSALCFANSLSVEFWTRETMDAILNEGIQLHTRCFPNRLVLQDSFLAFEDLENNLNSVKVLGKEVLCEAVVDSETQGPDLHGDGDRSLDKVLEYFFSTYSHGVFTCNSLSLGLFRDELGYCIYDPHSCNPVSGRMESEGVSITMVFVNIGSLISGLKDKFTGCRKMFQISPVKFQSLTNVGNNSGDIDESVNELANSVSAVQMNGSSAVVTNCCQDGRLYSEVVCRSPVVSFDDNFPMISSSRGKRPSDTIHTPPQSNKRPSQAEKKRLANRKKAEAMKKKRENKEFRENEKVKDAEAKKKARENEETRKIEKEKDTEARRKARENEET
uniref:Uncharacterized protein n=1 Tax=Cacopsylla melanoneura TaxID=428564 RepID=A0A8D9EHN1_9HEMI